jgi:hypothetical protein
VGHDVVEERPRVARQVVWAQRHLVGQPRSGSGDDRVEQLLLRAVVGLDVAQSGAGGRRDALQPCPGHPVGGELRLRGVE